MVLWVTISVFPFIRDILVADHNQHFSQPGTSYPAWAWCTFNANQSDLDDDLRILKEFNQCRFIWLLRTCGSTLVPIEIGADPIHITHWLFGSHGQSIHAFLVDTDNSSVEKITFAKAEKLIQKSPLEINISMTLEETRKSVLQTLRNGVSKGVWGVFSSPRVQLNDWEKWRSYFSNSGNWLMKSLMDKAIRRVALLASKEQKVA